MPDNAQGVVPAIPFVASAHEYTEVFATRTVTPTTAEQSLDPIDIPAYGFLRNVYLEITGSGGTAGPGVISADYPWNLISNISLSDVNGGNIYGPLDGYAAFLSNMVGGYTPRSNPGDDSTASLVSLTAPIFKLRVPVEITRKNGLGSLPNQSSSSNYKLNISINTIAKMFSTAPTTPPTFQIKLIMEAWTIPSAQDAYGNFQSQVPPLVGMGQYWTSRVQSGIVVGTNQVDFKRVGNYLRVVTLIARDATGARVNTVLPGTAQMQWDGITVRKETQTYNRNAFYEKLDGVATVPAGIMVFTYNHGGDGEGNIGNEDADLWLPTTQSTRLYVEGDFAVAGSVQVLTNDVSSVDTSPVSRYVAPNATGRLLSPAQ